MNGYIFSDAREALRRITELEKSLDQYRSLFDRLNTDTTLEYSIGNLIHLLEKTIDAHERKMYVGEFNQSSVDVQLSDALARERASEARYNNLLPLLKTTTQQNVALVKDLRESQRKHGLAVEEATTLKRERDLAENIKREKEFELTKEKEKRQKLRPVYSALKISFNELDQTEEIKTALVNFQKILMN